MVGLVYPIRWLAVYCMWWSGMTLEKHLWSRFREAVGTNAFLTRIENSVEVGTPDVHGRAVVGDFWVELKSVERPKRSSTLISVEHFTGAQRRWLVDYARYGGRGYVLIQIGDTLYLINGAVAALYLGRLNELEIASKSVAFGGEMLEIVKRVLDI